jgi:predicted ATPase
MALIEQVTISGFRGARDVVLVPGSTCVLVGESSSGKSTVLSAIWTLLEAAAPMPTGEDVSRGHTRVHVEAVVGDRTLFLDARPPATINLNREGAPPAIFFPANLRPTTLLAPADHPAKRAIGVVRAIEPNPDGGLSLVRSIAALDEARVRGLVILIEEPELYLSPPAQRHLHRLLRKLSARGRNQILYSTHSPVFLGVDRLDELVLVRHDERTGTRLLQPEALPQKQAFRMSAEIDAERAEIFLSRAVLFGRRADREACVPVRLRGARLRRRPGGDRDRRQCGQGQHATVRRDLQRMRDPVHRRARPRRTTGRTARRGGAHRERHDPPRRRETPLDRAHTGLRGRHRAQGATRQAGCRVEAVPQWQRRCTRPAPRGGRARGRSCAARAAHDPRCLASTTQRPARRRGEA